MYMYKSVLAIYIPSVDRFQADKTGVSLIDIPHLFHNEKTSKQMTNFLDYTFEKKNFFSNIFRRTNTLICRNITLNNSF